MQWGFCVCVCFHRSAFYYFYTCDIVCQPHVQISGKGGKNHASLCITRTCSCAYFEELSNDTAEWCNVLSQSRIHVVCNGVCSQPNSCDLSCLQSALQANPGCAAHRGVLDSLPRSCWGSGPAATFSNPGSVLWNDSWSSSLCKKKKNPHRHTTETETQKVCKLRILNQFIRVVNHFSGIKAIICLLDGSV